MKGESRRNEEEQRKNMRGDDEAPEPLRSPFYLLRVNLPKSVKVGSNRQ